MKTKQIFITLLFLLFLVIAGLSEIARAQESSKVQQDKERHKEISRFFWDRGGASISTEALLRDAEFRAALGVSDEYYQKIQTSASNAVGRLADDLEYQKLNQESDELFRVLWGVEPGWNSAITERELERARNADPEVIRRANEVGQRLESMRQEYLAGSSERHTAAIEDALLPEIKQKIREAHLAAMGEMSTFSPRLFEALYLTDAQKQQMERIKKGLEPELEKHLEIYGNNAAKILERVNAALSRPDVQRSIADNGQGAFLRKLQEEPEHKKLLDESYASSKAFATLFRTRMSEILTKVQREHLQLLIDNPPPHAWYLIQRLRRENWGQYKEVESDSSESKKAGGEKDIWVPGPDSWKPGDPLPPGVVLPEKPPGSFPREEN